MPSNIERKQELRQQFLQRRQAMSQEDWREGSEAITRRVLELPEVRDAKRALCIVSTKDNEVHTQPLIQALLDQGCEVAVPRSLPGKTLEWRKITQLAHLSRARFGILEPHDACPVIKDPQTADVCFVPGIVWDHSGHRIGYGSGYFDLFLSTYEGREIGLAFDFQVLEAIPHEPHDQPVGKVVTEKRLLHVR